MTRLLLLVAALPFATVASGCVSIAEDFSGSQVAIERCLAEIEKREPGFRLESVDRAYAFSADRQVELLFAMGEMGWFGPRSEEFRADFSCGVIFSSSATRIYHLGPQVPRVPYVSSADVEYLLDRPDRSGIRASLHLRKGKRFELVDERAFEESWMETRPDDIRDDRSILE